MPRYRVTNRVTGETAEIEAPFAQDACEWLGWPIAMCYVKMLREGPFSDLGRAVTWTRRRAWEEPDPPEEDQPF